jgi:hypothetical protein
VPARYAGWRLTVRLSATTVEVYDGAAVVAARERAVGRRVEVLALDHYLEVLKTKPGRRPPRPRRRRGTRALIEVLLKHRTLPHNAFQTAMATAITTGLLDPQVVIIEARRQSHHGVADGAAVPIGVWAHYDRPARPWPAMTHC